MSALTLPEASWPGQLAMPGTCVPQMRLEPLPPVTSRPLKREGVPPPVPLSPMMTTSVFSRSFSSSSLAMTLPMSLSV
jgi:hypothetical protein